MVERLLSRHDRPTGFTRTHAIIYERLVHKYKYAILQLQLRKTIFENLVFKKMDW